MAHLVARSGPAAGKVWPLDKPHLILGRGLHVDVPLPDHLASREHADIRKDGALVSLIDRGSRNGTLVNGIRTRESLLDYGDRIRVGEVEFELVKDPGDLGLSDLLPRYEIQERLGEGGMGIVFKAMQKSMARPVALKLLKPKYGRRPNHVEQFIAEAQAAGRMAHANLIQVFDVGTENGLHFFAMELIDGPTCLSLMRELGKLEPAEALEIVRQAAEALDYAHGQRLLHRDVKPDNLMIAQGSVVKLADLGISRTIDELDAELEKGRPTRVVGTPAYLAPEAAQGLRTDHRADLYSLGATLFHFLTGRPPFPAATPAEQARAHVYEPVPDLLAIAPEVPKELADLVHRLLAKDPAARPESAVALKLECDRMLPRMGKFARTREGRVDLFSRWNGQSGTAQGEATPEAATALSGLHPAQGGGTVKRRKTGNAKTARGEPIRPRRSLRLVRGLALLLLAAAGGWLAATILAEPAANPAKATAPAPAPEPKVLRPAQQLDWAVAEVRRRLGASDFPGAVAAVPAIPEDGLDQTSTQRREQLLNEITQARMRFAGAFATDLAKAAARRDLPALEALRNKLPPSLNGGAESIAVGQAIAEVMLQRNAPAR